MRRDIFLQGARPGTRVLRRCLLHGVLPSHRKPRRYLRRSVRCPFHFPLSSPLSFSSFVAPFVFLFRRHFRFFSFVAPSIFLPCSRFLLPHSVTYCTVTASSNPAAASLPWSTPLLCSFDVACTSSLFLHVVHSLFVTSCACTSCLTAGSQRASTTRSSWHCTCAATAVPRRRPSRRILNSSRRCGGALSPCVSLHCVVHFS